MPTYKDPSNKIHVLDSAKYEHLLPPGCVALADAEASAIFSKAKEAADKSPKPPKVTLVDQILADPVELAKLKTALGA